MEKLTTRQFGLYVLLVTVAKVDPDRWVDKFEIADHIGKEHYQIAVDRLNNITQVEKREKENGVMNIFDIMEEYKMKIKRRI